MTRASLRLRGRNVFLFLGTLFFSFMCCVFRCEMNMMVGGRGDDEDDDHSRSMADVR